MSRITVGVPKEIKAQEGRVALTPEGAGRLIDGIGASAIVEHGAGEAAGFSDAAYRRAGAVWAMDAHPLWIMSDLVLKVKEPLPSEYRYLQYPQLLFTYLHPAGNKELVWALLHSGRAAIAYEDVVEMVNGRPTYPLLAPMSRIAGVQALRGALCWHRDHGRADYTKLRAVIIGGGTAGEAALNQALVEELESIVVFESRMERVRELSDKYVAEKNVHIFPLPASLGFLRKADIVVSTPMLPGGQKAPSVLTENEHFQHMKTGCYAVDVSIDQGGSLEHTKGRPTKPGEVFVAGSRGIVFSAVPNIPGSTVPDEATQALTQATFPYVEYLVREMADDPEHGLEHALQNSPALRAGLQVWKGKLLNESVAKDFGLESYYEPAEKLFG